MQLLGPVRTSVLALALTCLVRAQDATTAFPETTSYFDVTSGDLTTTVNEDSTTIDTTDAGFRSAETETEQTTTAEQLSTTESTVGESATDSVTSGDDGTTISTPPAEEAAKKAHLPDVAETSTAATPERKPVKEPPFIKKYWPLLCFATKCDKRGSAPAPVVPNPDAPEVRSDLEESRSANSGEAEDDSSVSEVLQTDNDSRSSTEVLKALEEQMLGDQPATVSMQTTDKSTETTRFSSGESSEEESNVNNKPETTTTKSSNEDEDKDEKEDADNDDDDDDDDNDDKKKKDDD